MSRLTAKELHGIWAGITMSWDEHDRFDEASYRSNVVAMCRAGVHGLYTTGSTGEFYAVEFDEFCRMVDIQAELCGQHKMPLQIGCCADSTRKALRLLEYAASKPQVGAAQVTLPYWMEVNDREMVEFFHDLYRACPELPLVHYNIPRAKRFLNAPDYLRILEVAPTLIGVKYTFASSHFGELQETIRLTPFLSYFVAENLLASAMMLGARGSCSSVVSANPNFMLALYAHAAAGRWAEAVQMQQLISRFYAEAIPFIEARSEGTMDPVFDKGMAVATGGCAGSQRTRAPYIGWSDDTVLAFRQWMRSHYPQLLHPACQ